MGLLAQLHRLGTAAGSEFVEEPARVSFHRVLADKQAVGDLAVAESGGDQGENFQFTWGDAQFANPLLIGRKRSGGRKRRLLPFSGQCQPKPDAESGENRGDQAAVDFDGVFET